MSKADSIFKEMCLKIINEGFSSEGYDVRPRWPDGVPAHTIKAFGIVNRYDLSEEFPALTLRPTYIKSAVDEMLWIWQRKSNNICDMKSTVWDEWADENGCIGKAYGYQQAKLYAYNGITPEGLAKAFPGIKEGVMTKSAINEHTSFGQGYQTYGYAYTPDQHGCGFIGHPIAVCYKECFYMTQLDKAIYDLVNNPLSRRIIVSMWNPEDLHAMNLEPCAYSVTFNVTGNRLNAVLNQRSQDILAAGNWNVVQYAVLIHMLAQVTGLVPGELVHVIADAHIYDRHVEIIKKMISRPQYPAPKFSLNPEISSFYDFKTKDVHILDYKTNPQIMDIPIAI